MIAFIDILGLSLFLVLCYNIILILLMLHLRSSQKLITGLTAKSFKFKYTKSEEKHDSLSFT